MQRQASGRLEAIDAAKQVPASVAPTVTPEGLPPAHGSYWVTVVASEAGVPVVGTPVAGTVVASTVVVGTVGAEAAMVVGAAVPLLPWAPPDEHPPATAATVARPTASDTHSAPTLLRMPDV